MLGRQDGERAERVWIGWSMQVQEVLLGHHHKVALRRGLRREPGQELVVQTGWAMAELHPTMPALQLQHM